jgi:DNA repair protein RecN (Recombination protein N)
MLRRLHVSNYLLIDRLDLPFDQGLTILTGETGSGKSVLLGALGLALGDRAEGEMHRDPGQRCVIELELDTRGLELGDWFAAHEVPADEPVILRRQLEPGGRSRSFVNDTPVRLDQLRSLGARLVHVHGQHGTLAINDTRLQLTLVDHVAGTSAEAAAYGTRYRTWRALKDELERTSEAEARSRAEQEFIAFQLAELDQVAPRAGEQQAMEQELARADHAEELVAALSATDQGIAGEGGLLEALARSRQALARLARHDAGVQTLSDRLRSVEIELRDIAAEADALAGRVSLDPAEAARLRERLDTLLRIQQKHRVSSESELIALHGSFRERLAEMSGLGDRIAVLEAAEERERRALVDAASALSAKRKEAMEGLSARITSRLRELAMPRAVFHLAHTALIEPGPHGIDQVRALFAAGPMGKVDEVVPEPLDRVASGGELSRVMLALLAEVADARGLPTMVFDEIDTGISGEVADRVGALLDELARSRQVLAITHLPQVASKGHQHLLVSKQEEGGRTVLRADLLDGPGRVKAIAHMLSGSKVTKAALENARALLEQRAQRRSR